MKLQHIIEAENTCPRGQNRSATRLYLVFILSACLPLIGTPVRAVETGEFLEPFLAHSVLILMYRDKTWRLLARAFTFRRHRGSS
jgi:hypothetical protein